MKQHYLVTAAVVATLALAGCEKDEKDNTPVAARFTASIDGQQISRAGGTAWTAGDQIGVTGTSGTTEYVNILYNAGESQSDAPFTVVNDENAIYFQNAGEVTFTAYYPFKGTEKIKPEKVTKTISAADQTTTGQPKIDYLYGKGTGSKTSPTVTFTFTHRMSKLTLTFKKGADTKLSGMTAYTVKGLKMSGTFDPTTGTAAANAVPSTSLTMTPPDLSANPATYTASLILFPQAAAAGSVSVVVTLDGQKFTAPLAITDNELKAGNNYTFNVTVNKTGLSITPATIDPWDDKGTTEVGAVM